MENKNSPYFTTDNNNKVYCIKNNKTQPRNIDIKYTDKYKQLWSNQDDNGKKISVWKPVPEENYHIMGDIILEGDSDPNGVLQVPTVNGLTGKSVLYFESEPKCYGNKDMQICFWKPKNRQGYSNLGDIATIGRKNHLMNLFILFHLKIWRKL